MGTAAIAVDGASDEKVNSADNYMSKHPGFGVVPEPIINVHHEWESRYEKIIIRPY